MRIVLVLLEMEQGLPLIQGFDEALQLVAKENRGACPRIEYLEGFELYKGTDSRWWDAVVVSPSKLSQEQMTWISHHWKEFVQEEIDSQRWGYHHVGITLPQESNQDQLTQMYVYKEDIGSHVHRSPPEPLVDEVTKRATQLWRNGKQDLQPGDVFRFSPGEEPFWIGFQCICGLKHSREPHRRVVVDGQGLAMPPSVLHALAHHRDNVDPVWIEKIHRLPFDGIEPTLEECPAPIGYGEHRYLNR